MEAQELASAAAPGKTGLPRAASNRPRRELNSPGGDTIRYTTQALPRWAQNIIITRVQS